MQKQRSQFRVMARVFADYAAKYIDHNQEMDITVNKPLFMQILLKVLSLRGNDTLGELALYLGVAPGEALRQVQKMFEEQ